ncbi:HupC [alpha proteobacterium AAP81b]|nr:HupC [alpha proteobacterium AAP81b]
MATAAEINDMPAPAGQPYLFYRHALVVRATHWINALAIFFLLMTGLNIFNAHPSLYWGTHGANPDTALRWLQIGAQNVGGSLRGFIDILGARIDTTGLLGVSTHNGAPSVIGYPAWATFPSYRDLATARSFHFFFAWVLIVNGLAYLAYSLVTGHLRKNIIPNAHDLAPANIAHDVVQHAKLKFPKGEDAKRYHVLQKLAYGGVVVVLVPLVILTGLGMSPANNAAWPWILDIVGGRPNARSLHWVAANLIAIFIIVHVVMVVLAGPYNEIRSMITGKFRIDPETAK